MKRFITTLVFLSFSAHVYANTKTYQHGLQGTDLGGPHAITSISEGINFSGLTYDANGELSRVVKNGSEEKAFNYYVNRKLKQCVENQNLSTSFYYTSGGEKVASSGTDGKINLFVEPYLRFTNGAVRFSYGPDAEADETGDIKFSVRDHLGSVISSVSMAGILERQDTLPYGEIWHRDHVGVPVEKGFNGNLREGPLLDFEARHYLPEIGTFIQADPTIPKVDTQGYNRYMYVSANPMNRIDPTGLGDRESMADAYHLRDLTWERASVFLFGWGFHPQPIQGIYLSGEASGGFGPGVRTLVEIEAGGGAMFMPGLGDGTGGSWAPMGYMSAGGGQDYSPLIPLVGVSNTTEASVLFAPGGPYTSFTNTSTVSLDVPLLVGGTFTGREEYVVDLQTGERFFVTGAGWGAVGDASLVSGNAQIFLNVQTEEKLLYVEPENNWFVRTYMLAIEGIKSIIQGRKDEQEWLLHQEDPTYPAHLDENGVWVSDAPWNY